MTKDLENLSLSELVALHNQFAATPVTRFRNKPTAVSRTRAVLPMEADRPVAPKRRAAPHLDTCTALLARGATLDELCEATGADAPLVRRYIDQVRKRGHTVKRTGPKAWIINGC